MFNNETDLASERVVRNVLFEVELLGGRRRDVMGDGCGGVFQVGGFETIQGDGFPGTLNVECEVLVRARENFVWAIVGMLKWFPDGVMVDKDMYKCRCCQGCESGIEKGRLEVL